MTTTRLGTFYLEPVAEGLTPQTFVLAAVDRFNGGEAKFNVGGDSGRIEIAVETTTNVVALVTDRGLPTEKRTTLAHDDPRSNPMIARTRLGLGSSFSAQLPAPATTLFAPTWGDNGTTQTSWRERPIAIGMKESEQVISPRAPIGDLEVVVTARILVLGISPRSDQSATSATVDMVQ